MTQVKTSKNYRLSDTTLKQIQWLSQQMGDISATDVITVAVSEFHERKRLTGRAKLVQRGKVFDLYMGERLIATCAAKTVKALPTAIQIKLLEGQASEGALAALALAGARVKDKIVLYPESI